ncbi:methyltransferase domain-containing protein [Clostridium boliviensis]|uniref:Methyltransferase domain-containing protein n=1 Tax=Clostridium boliviensis TaxID=318465 RepID=A0ABU4GQL8_9CLOT|nr:methyltransferase domain-containing protein [Clostridium boliviensis]MDW2799915.1 methyltransferase domain-containing protein [Clostridium boliviensis]
MDIQDLHLEAAKNSRNYKTYEEMGDYYHLNGNLKRAYLCYAHSLFLCSSPKDVKRLTASMKDVEKDHSAQIPAAAFLIPSVPGLSMMKAIIQTCVLNREDVKTIIVMDDESSADVSQWLKEQDEIRIIPVKDLTPGAAFNKASELTDKQEDLLFLGKGSALLPHALFHLRMSLYKEDSIGAVNAVTNGPAFGLTDFNSPIDRASIYADEHNLPGDEQMDPVLMPSCNTVLLRRDLYGETGGFDEQFLTQEVTEKDFSFQLLKLKKITYLCHHGYVYSFGVEQSNQARWSDYNHFYQKWNVRLNYSLFPRPDILALIKDPSEAPIRVLDVGCACGASLLAIKKKYPSSEPHGIELDEGAWNISSMLFPVTQGNVEENLDYEEGYFDYIIFGDVLEHLHQPGAVLENMKRYLKPGGAILASIPNIMHISVVSNLLNGYFTYEESGILDKTHLRFFTKNEITRMFSQAGYQLEDIGVTRIYITPAQQKLIEQLCSISTSSMDAFTTYQYLIRARKK